MSRNPLIIYHDDCFDGFAAAWIAQHTIAEECELLPAKYGDEPPDTQDRMVYVLDFSYTREQMVLMHRRATLMIVLDHHKTAAEACMGLDFCTFDMQRSGCGLAWNYFQGGERPPRWIQYIEDRDIWKFRYGEATRYFHAFLSSMPMTINAWDTLTHRPLKNMLASGRDIYDYINTLIDKEARQARMIEFCGEPAVVLNFTRANNSEMGHYLLTTHPKASFSITYYQVNDSSWRYDLRSGVKKQFDVGALAKTFGGGGHAKAAGFTTSFLLGDIG